MLESCCIDTAAVDGCRSCCSDLHRNIFAELFVAARHVDEDTDLAAHVDVAGNAAFRLIADEAAQGDLLANRSRCFRYESSDCLAVDLACVEGIKVSRVRSSDVLCDLLFEGTELLVASSEVRLAVDFDEDADFGIVADVSCDSTLCSDAASLLLSLRDALLTEPVDCLFLVAVRSRQGLLAVHHACARRLAQLFYHCSRNLCHWFFPPNKREG